MNVLFISHNGLAEPLGRSQVLAYLEALVPLGHRFELVTFEPSERDSHLPIFERDGIRHHPLPRTPGSSVAAKVRDLTKGLLVGRSILSKTRIDLIHARSLLPAALADVLRGGHKRTVPMLFDLPGFLPQEFVDARHWTRGELRYRIAQEAEDILITRAQGIAVGTRPAADIIEERVGLAGRLPPVEIVPSCVDTERFRPDPEARASTRRIFHVGNAPLVIYSGSLGSWYLHEEMLRFFAALQRRHRDARFVVATRSNARALLETARHLKVAERVSVFRMEPEEMPALLAGADLGLCFVAPAPSKRASSPVKLAEYLACGLPTLVNAGVGDMELHAANCSAVWLLDDLSEQSLARVADHLPVIFDRQTRLAARRYALEQFDLKKVGAERYHRLYQRTLGSR